MRGVACRNGSVAADEGCYLEPTGPSNLKPCPDRIENQQTPIVRP